VQLGNGAVHTRVLADGAVETPKIASLAVTNAKIARLAVTDAVIANATITKLKIGDQEVDIQRMLDPVDFTRERANASNQTLDSTWRYQADVNISVPTWAGEMLLVAQGAVQLSGVGGNALVLARLKLDDSATPTSGHAVSVISGETTSVGEFDSAIIVSPASTINTRLWAQVFSGTSPQNTNVWTLDVYAYFKR
jgi:hypothetical protein